MDLIGPVLWYAQGYCFVLVLIDEKIGYLEADPKMSDPEDSDFGLVKIWLKCYGWVFQKFRWISAST